MNANPVVLIIGTFFSCCYAPDASCSACMHSDIMLEFVLVVVVAVVVLLVVVLVLVPCHIMSCPCSVLVSAHPPSPSPNQQHLTPHLYHR